MHKTDIAIIGGSAAGSSAAAQARRINRDAKIAIFETGEFVSYSTCALPYYISGLIDDYRKLISRTPESFKTKENIDVFNFTQVKEIIPSRKEILVTDIKNGEDSVFNYSRLIIATGASALIPPLFNNRPDNVFILRHLEDSIKINDYIMNNNPVKVLIIGGGFIALQLSEAFRNRFMDVTIVEKRDRIIGDFSPHISELVRKHLEKKGVKVFVRENVTGFDLKDGICSGVKTEKNYYRTHMVILSTGIKPVTDLPRNCGVNMGITGAIKVNEYMETNISHIYGAGNCVENINLITGKSAWTPLGTNSNKQGKVAGTNAAGGRDYFSPVTGSSIVESFNMAIGKTGLSEEEAKKAGYKVKSGFYQGYSKAGYYPGSSIISMELIAEKFTGKILGAQLAGPDGADKRLDVLATAITGGMTLDQFRRLDLSYSCPFSTVIDFTAGAAYDLAKKIEMD